MNFTYDQSGTPQQVKWVTDAINQCSFPIEKLFWVDVLVKWGPLPGHADTRHPYMVTEVNASDSFTITIAPWADDPNNFNNQGLPDPPNDTYEFYKQSFVHELGHVLTYVTFDPAGFDTDPRIAQVCSLFWHPSVDPGSGRRYGTMDDWDLPTLAWADEIREAVAEVFKVAFFTGRLIYTNRTNWKIDHAQWSAFLQFLQFHTPLFHEEFTPQNYPTRVQVDSSAARLGPYWVSPGGSNILEIADGELILPMQSTPTDNTQDTIGSTTVAAQVGLASIKLVTFQWTETPPPQNQAASVLVGATQVESVFIQAYAQWTNSGVPPGPNKPANVLIVTGHNESASVPTSGFMQGGYWVACRITETEVSGELWNSDPAEGGAPLFSVSVPYTPPPGLLAAFCGAAATSVFTSDGSPDPFPGTAGVVMSDWRWADELVNPGADYPFAPQYGEMAFGAAATGLLFVGNAP